MSGSGSVRASEAAVQPSVIRVVVDVRGRARDSPRVTKGGVQHVDFSVPRCGPTRWTRLGRCRLQRVYFVARRAGNAPSAVRRPATASTAPPAPAAAGPGGLSWGESRSRVLAMGPGVRHVWAWGPGCLQAVPVQAVQTIAQRSVVVQLGDAEVVLLDERDGIHLEGQQTLPPRPPRRPPDPAPPRPTRRSEPSLFHRGVARPIRRVHFEDSALSESAARLEADPSHIIVPPCVFSQG